MRKLLIGNFRRHHPTVVLSSPWPLLVAVTLFRQCDLKIGQMVPENNRAPLLFPSKLYASLQSHRLFETDVSVRKRLNRGHIGDFFGCVSLQFD